MLRDGRRAVRAREVRTPKNEGKFIEALVALVSALSGRHPVRAIGIGAAGIVKGTTLVFSPNIPFIHDFDFRPLWPRSVRLRVDNDARCFARAELLKGVGRGAKSFFALTIGTGVGRAYGRNGKIVRVKRFEYPEFWEEKYQRVRDRRNDGKLADLLGWRLVPLIAPYEPEIIVAGGGVMEGRGFLRQLRRSFKAHGLGASVLRSRLGKNAVAIGAAVLFRD